MNKQEAIAVAAHYFPSYPTVNEFHVTKDAHVFEQLNDATNHARELEKRDKSKDEPVVFTVGRDEVAEPVADENTPPTLGEQIVAATKAVADAEADMKAKEAAIEGTAGIYKTNATKAFNKAKAIYDAAVAALELLQVDATGQQ